MLKAARGQRAVTQAAYATLPEGSRPSTVTAIAAAVQAASASPKTSIRAITAPRYLAFGAESRAEAIVDSFASRAGRRGGWVTVELSIWVSWGGLSEAQESGTGRRRNRCSLAGAGFACRGFSYICPIRRNIKPRQRTLHVMNTSARSLSRSSPNA